MTSRKRDVRQKKSLILFGPFLGEKTPPKAILRPHFYRKYHKNGRKGLIPPVFAKSYLGNSSRFFNSVKRFLSHKIQIFRCVETKKISKFDLRPVMGMTISTCLAGLYLKGSTKVGSNTGHQLILPDEFLGNTLFALFLSDKQKMNMTYI